MSCGSSASKPSGSSGYRLELVFHSNKHCGLAVQFADTVNVGHEVILSGNRPVELNL